jgi:hypothetical protein
MSSRSASEDRHDEPLGGHNLELFETPEEFVIALEGDVEDWLARFRRTASFPARQWAEGMLRAYQERWRGDAR